MALSAVAQTWPDKQTLEVAKKLVKDKSAELARAAEQIVTRLEKQLEAKSKQPAAKPTEARKPSAALPSTALPSTASKPGVQ